MHSSLRIFTIVAALATNLFCVVQARAQQVDIYVAINGNDQAAGTIRHPVKTLHRAQELSRVARERHPSAPVNIFLRQGTYYLDSSIVFTSRDNTTGDAALTCQSYAEEEVIVSGGRSLYLKWKPWKNGIYQAALPADFDFDQLFVNGIKQIRARYPNYDTSAKIFNGTARKALSYGRIKSWSHPAGGFIHALQKSHWGSLSYRITGKDGEDHLKVEGGYQINRSHQVDSNTIFVENILEELDVAHEWYCDRSTRTLYYMPPPGLDLQQAKIEVPVLMELIIFNGDTSHPVSNIHLKGITFTHTKETFMLTREPLLRGDWNIFRGGAVLLSGTAHCTISDCNFESPGGNAVFFSNYNRSDTIEHCLIRNAGASGICFVGDPLAVRSPSFDYGQYVLYDQLDKKAGPKNKNFPQNCYVYDNLIYNTGRIEKQTAGVHLSMCMNISVVHNTIYHVPRAGININDGTWGGHLIEGNDVFETVLETGDHGAFNSWGRDRFWAPDRSYMDSLAAENPEIIKLDVIHPVVIRHNRFRCDHGWDIDLDDGSGNYIIDSNLCLNGGIKLREGFYRSVKNNIMVNNTFHPHVWFKNSHTTFMHNIVMRPYAPIQISYWGDSVDYNLFPDSASLTRAWAHGTDRHSVTEFPSFYSASKGDYRVKMDEMVHSVGFRNFVMNDFGVTSPRLKAMAKQPVFPIPVGPVMTREKRQILRWKGAVLKKVEGLNEQSALGLASPEGIYITALLMNSYAGKNGLRKNDVILEVEKIKIRSLDDFLKALKNNQNKEAIHITIFRDQQNRILRLVKGGN